MTQVLYAADDALVLENSALKVTVTPSPGSISVYDKESGHIWNQRKNATTTVFSNLLAAGRDLIRFDAVFHLERTGQTDAASPGHIELCLAGRNLTLTIGMKDTNTPVEAFDFIEPFQPSKDMSLVVPDFCDGHIYPCNLPAWPHYNLDSIRVLNLTMPWVGIVSLRGGEGYSVMFDTPCDAQLKLAARDGVRAPLVAWNPEKGRFGYSRSLTYSFTAHGGYVALAKAYRAHAKSEGLLVTFDEKARNRTNIFKLYGAPALWDFQHRLSDLELRARGVARAIHHVERWDGGSVTRADLDTANSLGFVTEEYDYYLAGPVDGGAQHYQDYHIDASQCAKDASGKIIYLGDSSLGQAGLRCPEFYLPVAEKIIPARLKMYPQSARYFDQITQNFYGHDNGPRGGGSTDECWDAKHPETRRDWVTNVDNFYRYAAQTLGLITGAELGKFHQVPSTELFYGMGSWFWPWPDASFPEQRTAGSDWDTYEQWAISPAVRVPLWELVFHDCAEGLWYPWDGNDSCFHIAGWYQDQKDCFNVLYGTPALFLINDGRDSEYFHNPGRWLQSYRNTCKLQEVLANQEMTGHRFLTPDRAVQETAWADGTRVVVNFGTNDYLLKTGWLSSQLLKQYCFLANGPWGEVLRVPDQKLGRIVTHIRVPRYAFDDEQTCAGQSVDLAQWQMATNLIRVNVDELAGTTNVNFVIHPAKVQSNWNLRTTQVFQCDPTDGHRLEAIPWQHAGNDGIRINGLGSWIALDVMCRP